MHALSRARIDLLGIGFDNLSEAEVIEHILSGVDAADGGSVLTPNIDILRALTRDPELKRLAAEATLVVADGVPLLWAARLAKRPLAGQVAGSSLIFSLSEAAARRGASIFLLGGAPGVAVAAGKALRAKFPGLVVAGTSCPPRGFESNPAQLSALSAQLAAAEPDIVFCGLGFPKQERVSAALAPVLPAAWFIGCGAAITFAAGHIPRAPRWMQRSGLEWVHRLVREPRRLFKRYIIDDLPFAFGLMVRSARLRRACKAPGGSA